MAAATDADGATRAVRHATEVARASGGTVHIVAAWRGREGLLQDMASHADVPIVTHEVSEDPAGAVTRVALEEDADLIVIGTRSGRGTRRLTAVPETVLDRASCAVLVV